ncbi:S8 family serine peptidase [Hymenobacter sp. GOD-10R]|uniref:S8 family serine peptidase n=1 Tax=Hymenobacter sp. GOD-10R TaxID=3093922 RepID=UPI002D798DF3|nr:S8 family serine peptidase [Hymenobacter sp. GOD-10R]WRQ26428.1 S8 family serine peptidase [Hymenobacter sp. GOD-10R]
MRILLRFFADLSRSLAASLLLLSAGAAHAQAAKPTVHYWVFLRDKAGMRLQPATYFAPQAQARRQRQHLPAADSTDFPVRPDYVRRVQNLADTVTYVSRWFNAVACQATPAQAAALRQLSGVQAVVPRTTIDLAPASHAETVASTEKELTTADRQLARRQTASLGAAAFKQAGLAGRGLRIAIFDVGFLGVDRHLAFQHLMRDKRVVATHNFVREHTSVYASGRHGTEVLSCIAGLLPDGTPLGLAPQAEFLLARTERLYRELYVEEEAWLAAVEWADRNGADIINSSLGYTNRRYFPEQMNGRTSLVARAAELAARKGILVVNAAGNDGDDDWHTIGTPADGDSVLAVGGLDPDTYLHIDFSSYGPAAGRRLKPNVSAFGTVLAVAPGGGYVRTQGTSFSSPLVAGFAACVWQQNRQLPVMELFAKVQESATLYPYYDYAHGYGTPQASFFVAKPGSSVPAAAPSFDLVRQDSLLVVIIRPTAAFVPAHTLPLYADSVVAVTPDNLSGNVPAVGREEPIGTPDAKTPTDDSSTVPLTPPNYLYWHLANKQGVLRSYEVRDVTQRAVLRIPLRLLQPGDLVRVHYRGYTQSYLQP